MCPEILLHGLCCPWPSHWTRASHTALSPALASAAHQGSPRDHTTPSSVTTLSFCWKIHIHFCVSGKWLTRSAPLATVSTGSGSDSCATRVCENKDYTLGKNLIKIFPVLFFFILQGNEKKSCLTFFSFYLPTETPTGKALTQSWPEASAGLVG